MKKKKKMVRFVRRVGRLEGDLKRREEKRKEEKRIPTLTCMTTTSEIVRVVQFLTRLVRRLSQAARSFTKSRS